MKLIIQNDRIAATAIDEHQATGLEQAVIQAPEGFNLDQIGDYRFSDGALFLGPPLAKTPPDARTARRAELSDIRWQHEVGGTRLADGTPILTDRETQMKVTAAYVKAQSEVTYTVPQWKIAPGVFVPLDAMAINAIADAIEEHVQRCFTNEAVLSGKLDSAKTVAAINAVDLQAGWP